MKRAALAFLLLASMASAELYPRRAKPHAKALPDATSTPIFSIMLSQPNTGCSVHTSFFYTATSGAGSTVTHSGIFIWAFANNQGTVTGGMSDSGEVAVGVGCTAGCDSGSVAAVGQTATASVSFNNTLAVVGQFSWLPLNNTCGTLNVL